MLRPQRFCLSKCFPMAKIGYAHQKCLPGGTLLAGSHRDSGGNPRKSSLCDPFLYPRPTRLLIHDISLKAHCSICDTLYFPQVSRQATRIVLTPETESHL